MSDKCVMCQGETREVADWPLRHVLIVRKASRGETREVVDWTLCDSCNVATYISPGRPVSEETE